MNIEDVKVGTKLELEVINSLGNKVGQTFISQITDIIDPLNLVIAAPIHESRIAFIPLGAKIRVVFLHHKHGLLTFTGVVTKKDKDQSIVQLVVTIGSELEKIQRRNYFRLDCVLDVLYHVRPQQEENASDEDQNTAIAYKKAITRNISGCGACIVTDEEIADKTFIDLVLQLDTGVSIKTVCKIVRASASHEIKTKKYEYGLHYCEISQKDQDMMIKYIFDQQKRLLKKGL